jgi:hypothetical protein
MHAHDHTHRLEGDRRLLIAALALIAGLMIGEIVAGILAGSLALLADAGHLVSDALARAIVACAAALLIMDRSTYPPVSGALPPVPPPAAPTLRPRGNCRVLFSVGPGLARAIVACAACVRS